VLILVIRIENEMNKDLRIIYMGTPKFAVPTLSQLVNKGWNIVAVVTAPDKPQGRGQKITYSPVKECAIKHNIPVLQPEKLKSPEFIEELKSYKADLQIVVAFRMLPEIIWNMPRLGTFNLHASLLPDYRGAAPINWAIINGETETGITTFFLQHEIDTGEIIFQEKEPIHAEDNIGTLYERLMIKGADLVNKTVEEIAKGTVKTSPQVLKETMKHAPKIHKETCKLDWNQSAENIHNLVRGLSPYPAAWTDQLLTKSCKIFKTSYSSQNIEGLTSGKYRTDGKNYIEVQTGNGTLSILELQLEGKKRMEIKEFLRGNKI
jgi:methionyl-tRNA formyltransferase